MPDHLEKGMTGIHEVAAPLEKDILSRNCMVIKVNMMTRNSVLIHAFLVYITLSLEFIVPFDSFEEDAEGTCRFCVCSYSIGKVILIF